MRAGIIAGMTTWRSGSIGGLRKIGISLKMMPPPAICADLIIGDKPRVCRSVPAAFPLAGEIIVTRVSLINGYDVRNQLLFRRCSANRHRDQVCAGGCAGIRRFCCSAPLLGYRLASESPQTSSGKRHSLTKPIRFSLGRWRWSTAAG